MTRGSSFQGASPNAKSVLSWDYFLCIPVFCTSTFPLYLSPPILAGLILLYCCCYYISGVLYLNVADGHIQWTNCITRNVSEA